MLIEDLIRLGSPYLKGNTSPKKIIERITDVTSPATKNFWQHVWIVEIYSRKISVFNTRWGEGENGTFVPDYNKIAAAPISLPSGGNKLHPQGFYPLMAYPLFDKHFTLFIEDVLAIEKFLHGRLEKTEYKPDGLEVGRISRLLFEEFKKEYENNKDKKLGVLIIASIEDDGLYHYSDEMIKDSDDTTTAIGESRINLGKYIVVDLSKVSELVWRAKEKEGMQKGYLEKSRCDITGEPGVVISSYNKTWPWYTTTWEAPFSIYQNKDNLVESISLSIYSYRCLTYGANLVKRLTKSIPYWLTKEIFSPTESLNAKDYIKQIDDIYGFMYVLPVADTFLEEKDEREDFINGIENMLSEEKGTYKGTTRLHLENIQYLEGLLALPYSLTESLRQDKYRLTAVYYSGNSDRGDIHLRAIIEDVVPSTVSAVNGVLENTIVEAENISEMLSLELHEGSHHFESLPYLLAKAYGGPYMWATLSDVLHKRPLDYGKFIRNSALRMNEISKQLLKNFYKLKNEALFYFVFLEFLNSYHKKIIKGGKTYMENWRRLYGEVSNPNILDLDIESPAEAGFVAGLLTRKFSQQYYASQLATVGEDDTQKKSRDSRKSFISQRVMAYGSTLTPEVIYKKALSKFKEYEFKLGINLSRDFENKNSILLLYYLNNSEKIRKNKDDFMAAFWAGYGLGLKSQEKEGNQNDK